MKQIRQFELRKPKDKELTPLELVVYLRNTCEYNAQTGVFATEDTITQQNRYFIATIKNKNYPVARLIYGMVYGYFPEMVDHKNRDTLDNRLVNLRAASRTENAQNRNIGKNNKSGAIGLRLMESGKYRVTITVNKQVIALGTYNSYETAKEIRRQAELKYFGAFAPQQTSLATSNNA